MKNLDRSAILQIMKNSRKAILQNILLILLCSPKLSAQPTLTQFGFKVSKVKKPSTEYYRIDSSGSDLYKIDKDYYSKNNYAAIEFFTNFDISTKHGLNVEMRFKHWGFKEMFFLPFNATMPGQLPFTSIGSNTYVNTFDFSVNYVRKFVISQKFGIAIKGGPSIFRPISKGFDSTLFLGFNADIRYNYSYVGAVYKFGFNAGCILSYTLSSKYNIIVTGNYYSPFNNSYNWIYAIKGAQTGYPLVKYRKQTNGFYQGFGISKVIKHKKKVRDF